MNLTKEEQALRAITVIENTLKEEIEWSYRKDEDDPLVIYTGVTGSDLPMPMIIRVYEDNLSASILSEVKVEANEDNVMELMVALCIINNSLTVGNFDFHLENDTVWYRVSTYFQDTEFSTAAALYLVSATVSCVEEYNDKILLLSKGLMTLKELYEFVNHGEE